jgi:hypothetical protein
MSSSVKITMGPSLQISGGNSVDDLICQLSDYVKYLERENEFQGKGLYSNCKANLISLPSRNDALLSGIIFKTIWKKDSESGWDIHEFGFGNDKRWDIKGNPISQGLEWVFETKYRKFTPYSIETVVEKIRDLIQELTCEWKIDIDFPCKFNKSNTQGYYGKEILIRCINDMCNISATCEITSNVITVLCKSQEDFRKFKILFKVEE